MKTILFIMIGLSTILSADFTRDANGIVTDKSTGLVWQDDAIGSLTTWQNSIEQCENLSLGGHADWRLPNLNELTSLVDDRKYRPSINDVFQNTESLYYYWSSTTHAYRNSRAWSVDFDSGLQNYSSKDYDYFVRCVRDGQ